MALHANANNLFGFQHQYQSTTTFLKPYLERDISFDIRRHFYLCYIF